MIKKSNVLRLFAFLLTCGLTHGGATAETYYVNSTNAGNNGFDGKAETWQGLGVYGGIRGPFRTITYALTFAQTSGDTIYVKATSTPYDTFVVDSDNDGISIIGYNSTTGDLDASEGMPFDYDTDINHSSSDISSYPSGSWGVPTGSIDDAPRVTGSSRTSGNAIDVSGANGVTIKNFWVDNASIGVRLYNSTSCTIENMYVFNCGGRNNPEWDDNDEWFDGRGIQVSDSDDNDVQFCTCYNVGHIAYNVLRSDDNTVFGSHAWCDDDGYGFDSNIHYYFNVSNDSDGNDVSYCVAARLRFPADDEPIQHQGHGFVLQAYHGEEYTTAESCDDNEFHWCTAVNISDPYLVRGEAGKLDASKTTTGVGNRYTDCRSFIIPGEESFVNGYGNVMYGGICLVAGPVGTLFQNVRLENANTGLRGWGGGDEKYFFSGTSADGNVFHNCIFECNELAIDLDAYNDSGSKDFIDTLFLNCNWLAMDSGAFFLNLERDSDNNQFWNCIIDGFDNWEVSGGYSYNSSDFTADYCLFHGNGGSTSFDSSFTSGNSTGDPDFVDADWNISSTSDCRDNGVNITTFGSDDYDYDARDGTFDIGAQEY